MVASMPVDHQASERLDLRTEPVVGPLALKTILVMAGIQLVLAILHVSMVWQDDGALSQRLTRFVHMDREGNLPTWFAATQFLCLAFAFIVLSVLERDTLAPHSGRWQWSICALGAVLLSLDEGAALHEMLGTFLGALFAQAPDGSWLRALEGFPSYYWLLFYVPIVLPLVFTLLLFVARRIGRNRYLLFAGGFIYVLGAVVLDYLEGRYGAAGHAGLPLVLAGNRYLLDIFLIEESLEMLGLSIVLGAVMQHAANLMQRKRLHL